MLYVISNIWITVVLIAVQQAGILLHSDTLRGSWAVLT